MDELVRFGEKSGDGLTLAESSRSILVGVASPSIGPADIVRSLSDSCDGSKGREIAEV